MNVVHRPQDGKDQNDAEHSPPDQAGLEAEATSDELRSELETLVNALRSPLPADPYLAEPKCAEAIEKARSVFSSVQPPAASPASATSAAPLPTQIGPYRILGLLGQGGMGAVYKALHPRLEKVVALKVLASARLKTGDSVGRFEREMKAVGKLDHPHLIRALDAGEADGVHYLAMEYVDGVDLSALIRRHGPLPVNVACELITQAASALQAAHSRGMVHRDIKPANLMLARQEFGPPIVKVLDLGLALLSDNHAADSGGGLTGDGQVMGTVDYMAPEQATDSHGVDIRADVYSLGATLYSLLAGGPILQDRTNLSLIQKLMILATEPAPPIQGRRPDVSDALADVVHRMLAKRPEDRFATPAAAANALRPFAAGADLAALDQPPGTAVISSQPGVEDKTALLPATELRQVPALADRGVGARPPVPRRRTWFGLAAVAGAGILAAILLLLKTPHGDLQVTIPDDVPAEIRKQIQISVGGNGDAEIASAANGWKIEVKEGAYQIQLTGGGDQVELRDRSVTVRRNKTAIVEVVLKKSGSEPMSPAPRPANANADAHRQLAVWLKTLEPPPPLEVALEGGTTVGVQPQDPLPETPFEVITVMLIGKAADTEGDSLLAELGRRAQGVRLRWLNLKSESITTPGLVSVFEKLDKTQLGAVEVYGEMLGEEVLQSLTECPRLETLTLDCSREMNGQSLSRMKRLKSVHFVNAQHLTPDAFKVLGQVPRLNALQLGGFPIRPD